MGSWLREYTEVRLMVHEFLGTADLLETFLDKKLDQYEVSFKQYLVLSILGEGPKEYRWVMSDLKTRLAEISFQSSDCTRIVDKLVKAGLVIRQTRPSDDRRTVRVWLTGRGRVLVSKIDKGVCEMSFLPALGLSVNQVKGTCQKVREIICSCS